MENKWYVAIAVLVIILVLVIGVSGVVSPEGTSSGAGLVKVFVQ